MRVIDLENQEYVDIDEKYHRLLKECNKETCYNCKLGYTCNEFVTKYNTLPCNIIGYNQYIKPTRFHYLIEFLAGCVLVASIIVFLLIIASLVFVITGIGAM